MEELILKADTDPPVAPVNGIPEFDVDQQSASPEALQSWMATKAGTQGHDDLHPNQAFWASVTYTGAAFLDRSTPEWLVPNLIAENENYWLTGLWGVGKSAVALDLCFAAALGRPMMGARFYPKRPLSIVYITDEGLRGVRGRMLALCAYHEIPAPPFSVIVEMPQLFESGGAAGMLGLLDAWPSLASAGKVPEKPDLIVIDTWANATVGMDENSGKDSGMAQNAVKKMRSDLGCSTMLLHHPSKAGDVMRGHGSTHGGGDGIYEVVKRGTGGGAVHQHKLKDGERWEDATYRFQAESGTDANGLPWEGVRVIWTAQADVTGDTGDYTGTNEEKCFAALENDRWLPSRAVSLRVWETAGRANDAKKLLDAMVKAGSVESRETKSEAGALTRGVWEYKRVAE